MTVRIDPRYQAIARAAQKYPQKLDQISKYYYATHAGQGNVGMDNSNQLAKLATATPRIYAYFLSQLPPLLPADRLRDNWLMGEVLRDKGKDNRQAWSALLAALPRIRNEEIKKCLLSEMAQLRSPNLPPAILREVDKALSPLLNKDKYTEEEGRVFALYCFNAEWNMSLFQKAAGLLLAEDDRNCMLSSRDIVRHMIANAPKERLAEMADELEVLTAKLFALDKNPDDQIIAQFVVRVYKEYPKDPGKARVLLQKVCSPAWGEASSIWLPVHMEPICRRKGFSLNQLITWFPPLKGYEKLSAQRVPSAEELPAVATEQSIIFSGSSRKILEHEKNTAAALLKKLGSLPKFPVTIHLGSGEDYRIPVTQVTVEVLETPLAFSSEAPGNCNKQFYTFFLGNTHGRGSLAMQDVIDMLQDQGAYNDFSHEKVGLEGLISRGRIYHHRDHFKLPKDFPFEQFNGKKEAWKTFVRGRIGDNVPAPIAELFRQQGVNTYIWESKDLEDKVNVIIHLKGINYSILLLDHIPGLDLKQEPKAGSN